MCGLLAANECADVRELKAADLLQSEVLWLLLLLPLNETLR